MIPEDIRDAIARGDRAAVEVLLNAESDLNAISVDALFGMCVLAAAQSQSRNESRHQLEIGRLLVARGARADGPLGNERLLQSPLVMPITSLNVDGTDDMYAWYDLLIGAGADPNSISEVLVDGFRCRMLMLSRVCFFFPVTVLITTEDRFELIKILLRAGANPNPGVCDRALDLSRYGLPHSAAWALDDAVARAPELADNEHYVAAKRLVKGVIAAGSYKKYLRLPLQELLNLLSLAQRGHATTTDPVMKSLVGVDNHVVWNVLTYWAES